MQNQNTINQTVSVNQELLERMAHAAWKYGEFASHAFSLSWAISKLLEHTTQHHEAFSLAKTLNDLAVNMDEQDDIKELSGLLFEQIEQSQKQN